MFVFHGDWCSCRQRVGVEFKRADAPKVTPSMRIAMHDLKLDALYVRYPGAHRFSLADGVEAVPLWSLMPVKGLSLSREILSDRDKST